MSRGNVSCPAPPVPLPPPPFLCVAYHFCGWRDATAARVPTAPSVSPRPFPWAHAMHAFFLSVSGGTRHSPASPPIFLRL